MPARPLLPLAVTLLAPATLAAQATARPAPMRGASTRGAFVLLLHGTDTVGVERFARAPRKGGDSITVDLRANDGAHARETVIDSLGMVPRFTIEQWAAGATTDEVPVARLVMRFGADSAIADMNGQRQAIAAPAGTIPWVNPTFTLVEQVVRRARVLGGARTEVPMVDVNGAARFTAVVAKVGADSATVSFPDIVIRVALDRAGHITGARIVEEDVLVVRTGPRPEPEPAPPSIVPMPTAPPTPAPRRPAPAVDYAPPAGAPYSATDATITAADGARLGGTFTRPTGTARVGAVLLLTGSGPEDRDEATTVIPGYRPFRQIADTLARRGVAVLRLDDRGVGASTAGASAQTTMETLADDARAAIAWLRARPDVDPARIMILGHSEGTAIANLVAADDRAIRGLVLMGAPASTGRATSDRQVRAALVRAFPDSSDAARERLFALNAVQIDSMAAHSAFLRSFLAFDPLAGARRVRQPVLILQGATDTQVPPAEAALLADAMRAAGNADVQVRTYAGTNHLFLADPVGEAGPRASLYAALPSKLVGPEVLGAVAEWVVERMK